MCKMFLVGTGGGEGVVDVTGIDKGLSADLSVCLPVYLSPIHFQSTEDWARGGEGDTLLKSSARKRRERVRLKR